MNLRPTESAYSGVGLEWDVTGIDMTETGEHPSAERHRLAGRALFAYRRRIGLAGLVIFISSIAAPGHGFAKKKPADWSSKTEVDASPANSSDASPCLPLRHTLDRHIADIRALKADLDRTKAAPPATLLGTFQQLIGNDYVSPAASRSQQKLAEEWNAAEEANTMLAAAQCPTVDIKSAVEKTVAATRALEAPPERKDQLILNEPIR